ncbi:MAG: hypothetical protein AAB473_03365 [Patescibacteria group bacterium]
MANPILSPELQAIEAQNRRDIRIVEARPKLMRVGFALAIIADVAMLAFFAFVIIGYVVSDSFTELRSAAGFDDNVAAMHAIAKGSDAQQLTLGSAKVVQGTATSYDFYATVKNPNADWYATFTYSFSAGGTVSRTEDGFVMPGEDKYLLSLGAKADSRPSSPSITLENIVWHRVNHHDAPDVPEWLTEHGNFLITAPTYAADIALANDKIGRTTFTVTNASPYSYWEPQFNVILERAGAVVGVSQATLSQFTAGEVRNSEVRWYGEIPLTATATVAPNVNFFDESSYMSPQGNQGIDPRDLLK